MWHSTRRRSNQRTLSECQSLHIRSHTSVCLPLIKVFFYSARETTSHKNQCVIDISITCLYRHETRQSTRADFMSYALSQVSVTYTVVQGSAATDLRWCENFNKFLFRNSLLNIIVKKLWKSVNICQIYRKNKSVSFFMDHSVDYNVLMLVSTAKRRYCYY